MITLLPSVFFKKYSHQMIGYTASLLILLFTYTAFNKWLSFKDFQAQMHNQEIPGWMASGLIWLLPPIEILTDGLLFSERSRLAGLWLSLVLMVFFTGYIALIVAGFYDRIPCSCGGVLRSMGWKTHLVFNAFFLLLSLVSIIHAYRERR